MNFNEKDLFGKNLFENNLINKKLYEKELLSPVGSLESLHSAVNAGADAVYTGGKMFGARAFADNFDTEELIEAIKFCHMYDVALYLTVNTLLTDKELDMLYDYLKPLYLAGLDAVIVQDIGVLEYISRTFPELKIHLSTQFTSTTHLSSEYFKKATRIVTPRELSLKEIEEYHRNSGLEIETFIHGALCYCYSGQCMMSYLVGGRSGNRGRCAQPCRKMYSIEENGNRQDGSLKGAFLSTKDICALPVLPKLMESPIYSFKIEGRMKKPEYVAVTTSIYRKYIDLYKKLGKDYEDFVKKDPQFHEDMIRLSDIYNRGGFAHSYFYKHNDTAMMSGNIVSHYGTLVGTVTDAAKGRFKASFFEKVNPSDVLAIREKISGDTLGNGSGGQGTIYEFTLPSDFNAGSYSGNCYSNIRISKQMPVYRIRNNSLIDEMNERYISKDKKLGIRMSFEASENMPIRLTATYCGDRINYDKPITVTAFGEAASKALKAPVTEKSVLEKLSKLGDSPFFLVEDGLSVIIEDGLFFPVSKLNELRRSAVSRMEELLKNRKARTDMPDKTVILPDEPFVNKNKQNASGKTDFKKIRYICLEDELTDENTDGYDLIIIEAAVFAKDLKYSLEKLKKEGYKTCVALPHIIRYEFMDKAVDLIKEIEEYEELTDCIMVRNLEGLSLVMSCGLKDKIIISDRNLYAFNSLSYDKLHELGVDLVAAPIENPDAKCDITGYDGYVPAMITAGCANKNISGCESGRRDSVTHKKVKKLFMSNEKNDRYLILNVCSFCYNIVFQSS